MAATIEPQTQRWDHNNIIGEFAKVHFGTHSEVTHNEVHHHHYGMSDSVLITANTPTVGITRDITGTSGNRLESFSEEQRINVLKWVSNTLYPRHHRDVYARVLEGTGAWFLTNASFRAWLENDQTSTLWLHGIRMSSSRLKHD